MNSDEQLAVRRLLAPFSERPLEVLEPAARLGRRERVVSRIQAVLDEPARGGALDSVKQLRWVKISTGLAVAAGLTLIVGRFLSPADGSATGELRALSSKGDILCGKSDGLGWQPCDPTRQAALSGVRTLSGASIYLETRLGARLALDPLATLELPKDTPSATAPSVISLTEGRADVSVPKLSPGQAFAIATPSATVTVHGTAFSVTVTRERGEATGTCVELREGIVSVESRGRTERLVAPARWGCAALPANDSEANRAADTDADREPAASEQGGGERSSATNPAAVENTTSTSTKRRSNLAREIRLLQQGLGAEQRQDRKSAEASYRALLRLYPNSVVAPEARAAIERIHGQAPAPK